VAFIATFGATVLFAQSQTRTQAIRPENFDSPEQAAKALIDAASKNDTQALAAILGSNARGILTSGNATQDQAERQEFAKLASAKNRVELSSMNNTIAANVPNSK
ncbi:MAG: DUF2950 family protein, partial [Pseudomonadota bacterium]|nr:DUF2950 family protein [Pseudomonadota bacterium]